MIKIYNYGEVLNSEIFARDNIAPDVEGIVAEIIATVIKEGDAALYGYAKKFDRAELDTLEVTKAEIDEALSLVAPEFLDILREAAENIRAFHSRQVKNSFIINNKNGVVIGQKVMPIEKVGLYVPGGTAAYPSTVLMDSIPAKLAGCREVPAAPAETTLPAQTTLPEETTVPVHTTVPVETTLPPETAVPTEPVSTTAPMEPVATESSSLPYLQFIQRADQSIFDGPGYDYALVGSMEQQVLVGIIGADEAFGVFFGANLGQVHPACAGFQLSPEVPLGIPGLLHDGVGAPLLHGAHKGIVVAGTVKNGLVRALDEL